MSTPGLAQALAVHAVGAPAGGPDLGRWGVVVHDGHDVFGIPHGGYLAALGAAAVLAATGQPDLFTTTTHYLRKAEVGPMVIDVGVVGGSRRFTTVHATATQGDQVVLSIMASVGDRGAIAGPSWHGAALPQIDDADLTAPAGDPSLPFQAPAIAARMGLRLEAATTGFAQGRTGPVARIRGVAHPDPADQLAALIACDLTPPAVWNALGMSGWVPTVELTAHVRARPAPGPMVVEATTAHVADGFLEEDALVVDATGALVVQSRQLARFSQPAG